MDKLLRYLIKYMPTSYQEKFIDNFFECTRNDILSYFLVDLLKNVQTNTLRWEFGVSNRQMVLNKSITTI